MGGLGWLPDTIMSRSVVIRMRRRHDGEPIEPYRRRVHEPDGYRVRDLIVAWARSAATAWPELPAGIQDRDADVWEPLIAVADAVGGQWATRARQAGLALIAQSKEDDTSLGIRLLADCRTVFEEATELPSRTILGHLLELPESPWGDIRGKPLDERGLAKRLKLYGVKPRTIRIGNTTPRCYLRADFEIQWRSYLPPLPPKTKTSETIKTTREKLPNVLAVAAVLDLAVNGREDATIRKCAHCEKDGDILQCAYGTVEVWLHRDCVETWTAAQHLGSADLIHRRRQDGAR